MGGAVAVDGATAIVGGYRIDTAAGEDTGIAKVYRKNRGVWREEATLSAPDAEEDDSFGISVAVSGNTALIGSNGGGGAYAFVRDGAGRWKFQQKLVKNADGSNAGKFGWSVAIDGNSAVISDLDEDLGNTEDVGSAYVFTRSGNVWTKRARLVPEDGATRDQFGYSVAISGTSIAIGTPQKDSLRNYDTGAVYMFDGSESSWRGRKISFPAASGNNYLGGSVALSGNTAVFGAYGDEFMAGAAYVFVREDNQWVKQATLKAGDRGQGQLFGRGVAIDGNLALIGAYYAGESNRGNAYVFQRSGTSWKQTSQLKPNDRNGFGFGIATAISDGSGWIGAPDTTFSQVVLNGGAAYVFPISAIPAKPDIAVFRAPKSPLKIGGTLAFGKVAIGRARVKTILIRNTGTARLKALAVKQEKSAVFSVTQPKKKSLVPGEATTFQVRFKPTRRKDERAAISIRSNDANESPYKFAAKGTGAAGK